MNLTPWFPADVKPHRPGLYLRDWNWGDAEPNLPDFWTGRAWMFQAMSGVFFHSHVSELPWRGLTTKGGK